MGFYGNITNTNKTQFTFDKIYENRRQMDLNVKTEGIYIGRYVLIDYGVEGEIKPWTVLFINPNTGHFLFAAPNVDAEGNTKYFEDTRALYTENGSYGHYINKGEIIYVDNAETGMKDFYLCSGSVEETVGEINQTFAVFEKISEEETDVLPSNYTLNYNIDRKVYDPNNSGRGFDSTVWQKVYVEEDGVEGEKYVMIAELNSVVPTFDIAVDAPSMEPITPHFDANSTDVYYRLHLQPQWGVRVRAADPSDAAKDEAKMKETGYYDYSRSVVDFDWSNYKSKLPSDTKVNTSITKYNPTTGKDEESRGKYDGAIYFNRAGFDVNKRYRSTDDYSTMVDDEISLRPLGASGQKYTIHRPGDMNPTEGYKLDIQEFVMMLPSLGDTICDLWDLAYGDWTFEYEADGETIKKDEFDNPIITYKPERNTDVSWGNKTGLRMVTRAARTDDNGNILDNGYEYDPMQVSTLAGCINSVHDLMGTIIVNSAKSENKPKIGDALTNHIYYGNFDYDENDPTTSGKENYYSYYIKYPKITLNELTPEGLEELKNSNKVISLTQFKEKEYYYTAESNWYLELTDRYLEGTNYYKKADVESMFDSIDLVGGYKPKKYYYQNELKDYWCELEPKPDSSKTYYYIASYDVKPITNVSNNVFLYNPPAEHTVTGTDEDGKPKTYTGYFYYNKEATEEAKKLDPIKYKDLIIYTPVVAGMEFNSTYNYFLGTNYEIDYEADINGKPVQLYDFASVKEDGTIDNYGKLTPVTFVAFYPTGGNPNDPDAPPTDYYAKVEDTENSVTNYIRLQDVEDIEEGVDYYIITPTETANSKKPFYQPDYYYAKNIAGDYLLSREADKRDMSYFVKNSTVINPTRDTFYISNRYYYENPAIPGEFILDINEKMTPGRKYFLRKFAYVIEDKRGILQPGSKWNVNITEIPSKDGEPLVTLGEKMEETPEQSWQWRELSGFARDLNTIHGLIVELQNKLKNNDIKTRDNDTVQGCINIMNDIINSFGTLVPKELMIVDEYGRMTSSPYTTEQSYVITHCVEDAPLINELPSADSEEVKEWISINIDDSVIEPMITIQHEYYPEEGQIYNVDLNDGTNNFLSYKPIVDNTGHVVGHDYENITLPYGFKTFEVENSDAVSDAANNVENTQVIADSTQDSVKFKASNKWIKFDTSEQDTVQVGHIISPATANKQFGQLSDLNTETLHSADNTFQIPNFTLDEAGHVIAAATQNVSVPNNFAKIKVEGSSTQITDSASGSGTVEADTLTDELTIASGNKWIEMNVNTESDKVEVLHYAKAFTKTTAADVDYNTSGNAITLQKLSYDNAGHITAEEETKYILPKNYQTLVISNTNANVTTLPEAVGESLVADSAIATATIDNGNRWIRLVADKNSRKVSIAHYGADITNTTSVGNADITFAFGGSINIPYFSYDNAGHIAASGVKTVSIPNSVSNTLLTGYVTVENGLLSETQTVAQAFAKLEQAVMSAKSSGDSNLASLTELINNNQTALSATITAEADRAVAEEQRIEAKIPTLPTTTSLGAGYYLLQINEDGTNQWIRVEYEPPVEEEPPAEEGGDEIEVH